MIEKAKEIRNNKKVQIAVIDSGIYTKHPIIRNLSLSKKSIAIHYSDSGVMIDNNTEDCFGHGTAVCGILAKMVPDVEIIIIKIFDHPDLQANEQQLITALDYIIQEVNCDIVHMSLGIVTHSNELHEKCRELRKQGIIMVAAYDNAGAISYPAVYPEVIGVDSDIRCTHTDDFFIIENAEDGNITILAKGGNHRLAWIEPLYVISQGSSFSSAYVTAYIARLLKNGMDRDLVLQKLESVAKKKVVLPKSEKPNLFHIPFEIRKAAIFPYNKEMHSLTNYSEDLGFEIKAVCDSKYSGRVGKKVYSLKRNKSYRVMDWEHIDWSEIDTLILGHTDELDRVVGISLKNELVKICLKNNINIYSFDDRDMELSSQQIKLSGIDIFIPQIKNTDYLNFYCGKLFQLKKPTIAVFGTSSKQGKFTLQVALRKAFIEYGYEVAQIGTEPSSLLFGFDACFPFGYNSTVNVSDGEFIQVLNKLMHDVEMRKNDAELMIIGCQSGTTPMLYNHIGQIPTRQLCFLLGTMPDATILCVNPDDDIDYIERTIKTIEGVADSAVIGIVLYPMSFLNGWQIMNSIKSRTKNIDEVKKRFEKLLDKKVFVLGDDKEIYRLCELCIDFLADEEEGFE